MRPPRRRAALIAAAALISSLLATVGPARAAAQLDVQVGGFLPGPRCNFETGAGCVPGDAMRFYAPTLKVMPGDVINFGFQGFHTATLAPANVDIASWVEDNAGGVGKPYSFLMEDPDDTQIDAGGSPATPSLKLNPAAGFADPTCGPPADPCPYDGSAVANSGLPFAADEWSVKIDADAGDTVWVLCLVHTQMRLKIVVVDDPSEVTTQGEIDAAAGAMLAKDNESAYAMHHKLSARQPKRRLPNGSLVWDVWAGWDNRSLSLLGMYPRRIRIRKGDRVRFHFTENIYEEHTVTFPFAKARNVANNNFVPVCDPDGDGGPGPDNPPELEEPPFCNDPSQLEFDVTPRFLYKQGDGVFKGNDYSNSGARGVGVTSTDDFYQLRFARRSSKKGYRYFCLIHGPFMGGRVVVR